VYLGPAIGFLLSTIVTGRIGDLVYAKVIKKHELVLTAHSSLTQLSARNGGKGKPEFRIPVLIVGSLFVPVGVL
jgi:hypothetical protein